jgi:hypothetical protein
MAPPSLHLMHDTASKGTLAIDQRNNWYHEQSSSCCGGTVAHVSSKSAEAAVRGCLLVKVLHVVES